MTRTRRRSAVIISVASLASIGALVATGADRREAPAAHGATFSGDRARVSGPGPAAGLVVATFNIHGGRDAEGRFDLARTADTLERFDLVALQEVHGPGLLGGPDQAESLGRLLAASWLYAGSETRWWREHRGNGIVSRIDVTEWRKEPLSTTRGRAYRNLVTVRTPVLAGVTLLATHIDRQEDHDHQLEHVIDVFLEHPPPVVLLGDLNESRDGPRIARLLTTPGVVEAGSVMERDLPERIDWIFARGLVVAAAGIIDRGASDHPCVWAEIARP